MNAPVPPARALFRQARSVPEEACLFFQEERGGTLDWSWWSWRQLAQQVLLGMEQLAASGTTDPGDTTEAIVFPYRPLPEYIAFDLAVQASGLLAVPVWAPEFVLPESVLPDVTTPDSTADVWRDRPIRRVERVPPAPEMPPWARSRGETPCWPNSELEDGRLAGPVMVSTSDGELDALDTAELDVAELLRRVEALDARLPPLPGRDRIPVPRDIVVSCRSLAQPDERVLLSWALWRGAAVAVDASPEAWLDIVGWVRPTVLHGSVDALLLVGRDLAHVYRPWWRRLFQRQGGRLRLAPPLDRLRAVVVTGDAPGASRLPRDEVAAWESFGIRVV